MADKGRPRMVRADSHDPYLEEVERKNAEAERKHREAVERGFHRWNSIVKARHAVSSIAKKRKDAEAAAEAKKSQNPLDKHLTEKKGWQYKGSTTTCTLCQTRDEFAKMTDIGPLCMRCYQTAFSAEMAVARKYKFEAATQVYEHVFLGPEGATFSHDWLKKNQIDRVITVAGHSGHLKRFQGIEYMTIEVSDMPEENVLRHCNEAFNFLNKSKKSNVLVHSVSGNSRAAAVVVAYVMQCKGLNYDRALALVKKGWPSVSINPGFVRQLEEYGEWLRVNGKLSKERRSSIDPTTLGDKGRVTIRLGAEVASSTPPNEELLSEQELKEVFEVFDSDNNGVISVDEIKTIFTQMKLGDHLPEEEAEEMIKMADSNGDGKISFAEFKAMMRGSSK